MAILQPSSGQEVSCFCQRIAAPAAISLGPEPVTVPGQTAIHVTLDHGLASNQSRSGDHFEATVSEPIVIDEHTVIPQGARAEGLVVDARPSGRWMGRARLELPNPSK